MAEIGVIASVVGVAGAGFRLALILHAVGLDIGNADVDILAVAKGVSLFSLMLKQVGLTLEAAESVASESAVDTAIELKDQSEMVFTEIQAMVDTVRKKDIKGNYKSVTVMQRVKWCFKKQRVQYLLGQLESLKLSLSVMLQILQLGKLIADSRKHPPRVTLTETRMLQERAEIQNMVVVRHWSLVDLARLYDLAETEAVQSRQSPPPSYKSVNGNGNACIAADPKSSDEEDLSKAIVVYKETPLDQLEDSMSEAMELPTLLMEPETGSDVVGDLLHEWTRIPESGSVRRHRTHRSRVDTDESDADPQHGDSSRAKGRFLEASTGNAQQVHPQQRKAKNVHFKARVESDLEDSDQGKPQKRPPTRHILRSNEDSSSDSSPERRPNGRSNNTKERLDIKIPTPASVPVLSSQRSNPPRSGSRTGPPSPGQHRPSPMAHPSWQGPPPASNPGQHRPVPTSYQPWAAPNGHANLRPPSSDGMMRNPYPPPPNYGPNPGQYLPPPGHAASPRPYPPPPPGSQGYNPQRRASFNPPPDNYREAPPSPRAMQDKSTERRERAKKRQQQLKKAEAADKRFKDKATKGFLATGAVAGLWEILEGLSAV